MPPDVSLAGTHHNREPTIEELKQELAEARDQQAATGEILRIISSSPSHLQPVLDTIVATATRLCGAEKATIRRRSGDAYHMVAEHGCSPEQRAYMEKNPVAAGPGTIVGRAAETRKPVYVADVEAYPGFTQMDLAKGAGFRAGLGVPLLREGEIIGVLMLLHSKPDPFTADHIERAQTFADQAVIAIENTRLFEAEQASNRELTEALEQQTATADVLKVISRSALGLQRVLDALVESAARLCDANDAVIYQAFGDSLRLVAHHGQIALGGPVGQYAFPLVHGSIPGRVVIDRRTIHIADVLSEADQYPRSRIRALQHGWRTALGVPLLHVSEALGVIVIRRTEVRPFTERQIELVNTFADQAVIAIENTRLFEEVQARTKELQESLDRQTATSEVLGVISRSPNEAQPVLDAIVATAHRLCQAERAIVWRLEGETFRAVAHRGQPEERVESVYSARMPVSRGSMSGRATLARRAVQVEDVTTDPELVAVAHAFGQAGNVHTVLAVPLLLKGHPIGAITLSRTKVAPFDDKQVALIESFADQAVIAIENARLFEAERTGKRELQESLEYQTATSDVLGVISRSAFELQPVLEAVVKSAIRLCGATRGHIFRVDGEYLRFAAAHGAWPGFTDYLETHPIRPGRSGATERAALERQTVHISDVLLDPDYHQLDLVKRQGYRTVLAVPMLREGTLLGVIAILKTHVDPFTDKQIALVETFADQAVIAIENARLFEEVQARTRELAKTVEELEIASQHKSQFVANMSHELRTPLAAILGYAELMQEGFYGNQSEKSMDALTRIRSNGKHLLGLINTVLDIAKIESGQFTLNMAEYAIESVVETVRSATESLAQNKKLALKTEVAKSLPIGLGDEQRLTQVLLNLVGNAIKFTDRGEVRVTARAVNGRFAVSVMDTGPGIPEAEQARIFEQFHQVDSSLTKAKGGTGLGLAIAKQIVEMHGGRIWVESTPGKGATFQMEFPTRAELRKGAP